MAGWVTLLSGLLVLFTTVVVWVLKSVRAPLQKDMDDLREHGEAKAKEHGERIGRVETACGQNDTKISQMEKAHDLLALQFMTMTKSVERVDAHVNQLLEQGRNNHDSVSAQISHILQRIARIEASRGIPPANDSGSAPNHH